MSCKSIRYMVMVVVPLAVAIVGATGAVPVKVAVQDDRGAPAVPGAVQPALFVQSEQTLSFAGGMSAVTMTSIGDVLVHPGRGELLRVASVTATQHLGNVMLEQVSTMQTVPVDSDQPITLQVGPFNTGLAGVLAAELLGETESAQARLAAGQLVQVHLITVKPLPGKTWGEVLVPTDLSVSITAAES